MNRSITYFTLLALPLCLNACTAGNSSYPSLAIRDVERVRGTAQPVEPQSPPAPPPPVSEELDVKIVRLLADAERAHKGFLAGSDSVSRTIAAARETTAPADEWVEAQVALADLQSLRSNAVIALAELDQLHAAERIAVPQSPTPSATAIAAAIERIGDWVSEEDQLISRLSEELAD
ncbi:MAG: hypothetical protein KUG65_12685 [Sphingomonadaceae bacterium]|nr:hypothetical protein [Sphingomonadaceae bacterium]